MPKLTLVEPSLIFFCPDSENKGVILDLTQGFEGHGATNMPKLTLGIWLQN
jgi:hypothetical protein